MGETDRNAIQSIQWKKDHVRIIDQTYLPRRKVYNDIRDMGSMWEAIKKLRLQGTPAVGIAGGYGFYLGIKDLPEASFQSFWVEVERVADYLQTACPAATSMEWTLERIKTTIQAHKDDPIKTIKEVALKTAETIHNEGNRICKEIGENGATLVHKNDKILTLSNTGMLATGQYGTAHSIIYHAHKAGKKIDVWVCETRPLLQGSRLTAWELKQNDIPMNLIVDSSAGYLMQQKKVDLVLAGANRIAANGDTTNCIGTYSLSVLAHENGIPFYIASPLSAIDTSIEKGSDIPVIERQEKEITFFNNSQVAPKKTRAFNPASDITPHTYINGFITEKGIIEPPFEKNFKKILQE